MSEPLHVKEKRVIHIPTGKEIIVYPHESGGWVDSTDCETRYPSSDIKVIR